MSSDGERRIVFLDLYTDHTQSIEPDADYATTRIRVIDSIDEDKFKRWALIVWVAGIGFLTDAYDIFALTMVIPMLNYVYWGGNMPHSYEVGLNIATLGGSIIGQLIFGIMADRLGRRKMYGMELLITIIGTLGVLMSSDGRSGSMSIIGWLIWWRVVVGIGIGADYPLSSVICAELAPKRLRGRMMALVFSCQPLGQLLAALVSVIVTGAYKSGIPAAATISNCIDDPACSQTLDSMWRWIIGIGALLAIGAIVFRIFIPESPRYTLYCTRRHRQAATDAVALYGRNSTMGVSAEAAALLRHEQLPDVEAQQRTGGPPPGPEDIQMREFESGTDTEVHRESGDTDRITPDARQELPNEQRARSQSPVASQEQYNPPRSRSLSPVGGTAHNASPRSPISSVDEPDFVEDGEVVQEPPIPWVEGAKDYFLAQKNYKILLATSACWLLNDLPFYGLGMNSPRIISLIWLDTPLPDSSVYSTLMNNGTQSLVVVSIGAMIGSGIFLLIVERFSRKWIQFYGFILLAVMFIIVGSTFQYLLNNRLSGAILPLYIICQILYNSGPNSTTYIIAAEVFPTRYRTTCHGIAAAFGKLGSVLAQVFLGYVQFGVYGYQDQQHWLGYVLLVFSSFMAVGAFITYRWIPETQERNGLSKSLEVLGADKKRK